MLNQGREFFKKKSSFFWGVVLIAFLIMGYFGMSKSRSINEELLRLHVIANSDSFEDQTIKLEVRDVVLQFVEQKFSQIEDKETMMENVNLNLENIKEAVREYLLSKSLDFDIQVELINMNFPTVEYGLLTVPTGRYDALRLIIGNGVGENWWCVLFPPLCLGNKTTLSFQNSRGDAMQDSLNMDKDYSELDLFRNELEPLQVKFKILELFQGPKRKMSVFK
jgi:stage II sporulation protein R